MEEKMRPDKEKARTADLPPPGHFLLESPLVAKVAEHHPADLGRFVVCPRPRQRIMISLCKDVTYGLNIRCRGWQRIRPTLQDRRTRPHGGEHSARLHR